MTVYTIWSIQEINFFCKIGKSKLNYAQFSMQHPLTYLIMTNK